MDILAILCLLSIALVLATWSSARGYFARGRLHGMHEATQEIVRGISSHYEVDGQTIPPGAAKAVEAMNSVIDGVSYGKRILRHHAHLWVFGDTIGKACWQKGYEAGKRKMAPKEDRILVELSRKDLLHLVCLAHLGFKHMIRTIAAWKCIASTAATRPRTDRSPSKSLKWLFRLRTVRSTTRSFIPTTA